METTHLHSELVKLVSQPHWVNIISQTHREELESGEPLLADYFTPFNDSVTGEKKSVEFDPCLLEFHNLIQLNLKPLSIEGFQVSNET